MATTLNLYAHVTEASQISAANKIEQGFGKRENEISAGRNVLDEDPKTRLSAKFKPKQPKIRRSGTGCISQISDRLFEGRYSPRLPNGKRLIRDVYAATREECEVKLDALIAEMKAEIQIERDKIKTNQSA